MDMFKIIKKLYVLVLLVLVSSCAKQQDFVYFQRNASDSTAVKTARFQKPVLAPGDMIAIAVTAVDPDVVKPFNMGGGTATAGAASTGSALPSHGYVLNQAGAIEFPVLGSISIAGLNTTETMSLIKEKLKSYVNNPMVDVKVMNHKFSVLGEVKLPGVYSIVNEQMTLTEAIALSGDLLISGVRKEVVVLRDINGVKTETVVDMTSNRLFESPVYYVQNNDIIYIKPTKARIASAGQTLQYTSLAIGSLSLLINLINLLTR